LVSLYRTPRLAWHHLSNETVSQWMCRIQSEVLGQHPMVNGGTMKAILEEHSEGSFSVTWGEEWSPVHFRWRWNSFGSQQQRIYWSDP
jgi:hypothetical protein